MLALVARQVLGRLTAGSVDAAPLVAALAGSARDDRLLVWSARAAVRHSLDEAREQGAAVLAVCPFYAGWISRHPAYRDLLYSEQSRAADGGTR
ncbi:N-acetyltransferase [Streptomyces albidoflavus]